MSLIRKLSMRGIRNFDDDNCDKIIEFSRPLTLILGPNGTGKTTIIECLRFVLSGEFPPDSDRGKAFVHDPMLKDTRSVRFLSFGNISDLMLLLCLKQRFKIIILLSGTNKRQCQGSNPRCCSKSIDNKQNNRSY